MKTRLLMLTIAAACLLAMSGTAGAIGGERPYAPVFLTALGTQTDTFSIVMLDPANEDGPVRLTDDTYDDINPIATADSRYILYSRGDLSVDAPFDLYLLDRDCLPTCEPKRLPDDAQGLHELRVSPVAPQFAGWGPNDTAYVFDVDSWTVTQIAADGWNATPAWSPDGSRIVVASDMDLPGDVVSDDLQILVPDGGTFVGTDLSKHTRINLTYSDVYLEETQPAWSPDGAWIAYIQHDFLGAEDAPFPDSPLGLMAIDAACVETPDTCLDSRRLLSAPGHNVSEFAWSPDGRYVAYVEGDPYFTSDGTGNLWIVDMKSGEPQEIDTNGSASHLAWAPDSTAIMFEQNSASSIDVYIAILGGGAPGPVLSGFRASARPYWAPRS